MKWREMGKYWKKILIQYNYFLFYIDNKLLHNMVIMPYFSTF